MKDRLNMHLLTTVFCIIITYVQLLKNVGLSQLIMKITRDNYQELTTMMTDFGLIKIKLEKSPLTDVFALKNVFRCSIISCVEPRGVATGVTFICVSVLSTQ